MTRPSLLDNLRTSLLPRERFIIRTRLRAADISRRVRSVTEPYQFRVIANPVRGDRPYHGEVSRYGFLIRRTKGFGYRNPFAPRIAGEVRAEGGQTIVEIVMEVEALANAIEIAIYSLIGVGFLIVLGVTLVGLANHSVSPGTAICASGTPVVLLILDAGMTNIWFSFEASRSRQFLQELLEDIETGYSE